MDDNKRFTPKLYGFIENLNIIGELEKNYRLILLVVVKNMELFLMMVE